MPKGFGDKPAEKAKPAETVKPAETTTKPKGTLPKGFGDKPAEKAKPAEVKPKPAETKAQPPVTVQEALENAYLYCSNDFLPRLQSKSYRLFTSS